ncbi:ABC transporter ATP-binding protein [Nocardioides sp.]|uniref:ABC transporter ATP-binding protein n=1 Tax=Nocardioides sp. TaxID=35761 RepID=UPI0039E5763F
MSELAGEPLVVVEGLGVAYPGRPPILREVDLTIRAGEVVLLLGASGSGKSTLAMALNGLVPGSIAAEVTGRIRVAGHDVATTPTARLAEQVAMVFQDTDIATVAASVYDEACFGAENLCHPVAEIAEGAAAALRRVGLWDRREEDPLRLSGGQRQRLAIAAALVQGSRLLILDEPTANLDQVATEELYDQLRAVKEDPGRAILLVEHDVDAALGLVDRIVALDRDGRVAVDGAVEEVLAGEGPDRLRKLGCPVPGPVLAARALAESGRRLDPVPRTAAAVAEALVALGVPPTGQTAPTRPTEPAEPAVPAHVRATGLQVRRRGRPVLHGIDLAIQPGSLTAVVGVNGAGKSTLAQTLAGLRRPHQGDLLVDGKRPWRLPSRELVSLTGLVFQNPEHQFVGRTVHDELAHDARRRGMAAAAVEEHVRRLLALLGLEDHAEQHPFTLSGGQKRRLSVASALGNGAGLLVVDEPTYGQDPENAARLCDLLVSSHTDGVTVVVVTHDLALAERIATQVVVLADGRVLAHDTTERVLADARLLADAGLRRPPMERALAAVPGAGQWWRGVREREASRP